MRKVRDEIGAQLDCTYHWDCKGLVHVVNFYIDEQHSEHKNKISLLARSESEESQALLEGYVREALRTSSRALSSHLLN